MCIVCERIEDILGADLAVLAPKLLVNARPPLNYRLRRFTG